MTLLLLSFSWINGFSQVVNLIPNPSFEEKVHFNQSISRSNWTKCLKNDTPDYIEFTKRGEPEFYYRKYIGGLLPFDGEAYAGIFCLRTNQLQGIKDIREFIQVPLKENLKKDTMYRISLAIALDPESTLAIDNINAYFSREPVYLKREKQMFELNPQVRFTRSYLESTTWTELVTSYKAKGYESQIILGNFMPDNRIRKKRVSYESKMQKKWNLHELEDAAYYYIDQVAIVKESEWNLLTKNDKARDSLSVLVEIPEQNQLVSSDEVPDTVYVDIEKAKVDSSIVLNNIFFEFDKSDLLPNSYKELDRLYKQLMDYQQLSIVIEGHTDNMGTFEYNMNLSDRRAQSVVDYLIERGLPQKRITFEGYGYTIPLSTNRDEVGRQQNRRVAFRIKEAE